MSTNNSQKAAMMTHGEKFGEYLCSLVSMLSIAENMPPMSDNDIQIERKNGNGSEEEKNKEESRSNIYAVFEVISADIQGTVIITKQRE